VRVRVSPTDHWFDFPSYFTTDENLFFPDAGRPDIVVMCSNACIKVVSQVIKPSIRPTQWCKQTPHWVFRLLSQSIVWRCSTRLSTPPSEVAGWSIARRVTTTHSLRAQSASALHILTTHDIQANQIRRSFVTCAHSLRNSGMGCRDGDTMR